MFGNTLYDQYVLSALTDEQLAQIEEQSRRLWQDVLKELSPPTAFRRRKYRYHRGRPDLRPRRADLERKYTEGYDDDGYGDGRDW